MNPVTALALAAFGLHQIGLEWGVSFRWADSFLDPCCFVPVALGVPSWLARRVQPDLLLSWSTVAGFTLVWAAAFEWWIPGFDPRFTADPLDALAYAAGAGMWRFVEPLGR